MRLYCVERKVYTIKLKFLALLFLVLMLGMLIVFVYNTCYSGTIREKAKLCANKVAISAINEAVNSALAEYKFRNEDFFDIAVKEDLSVSYIKLNTINANKFKNQINQSIVDTISKYSREEIYMTPFSMYGYTTVPFGLKIPVLVIPVEILSSDFTSKLESCGVNQSLHKLYIKIKIEIKLLLPVGSYEFEVETSVPISETVVVGNVPDTYTNVEGVTEPGTDTILNLAP